MIKISKIFKQKWDFETLAQKWDVEWGFSRPANFQFLSSYQAFLRLAKDYGIMLFFLFLAFCSTSLLFYSVGVLYYSQLFSTFFPLGVGLAVGTLSIWGAFFIDKTSIFFAYRKELQRETYGSSRWADADYLEDNNMIAPVGKTPDKFIALTRFQRDYDLILPLEKFGLGVGIFGPSGSGKTATVIMSILRQFSKYGGTVVVDPKGELYEYTSHYYNNIYRLDLLTPEFSDYFDLFGACRRNPTLAGKVAYYLMSSQGKSKDVIWEQAATGMVKALILHLCEVLDNPTPHSVYNFLELNPAKSKKRMNEETGKEEWFSPLHDAMSKSPSEEAKTTWGASFSQIAKETFGSVVFNMFANLEIFTDPNVQMVLRPPSPEESAAGRRRIDFSALREMYYENGRKVDKEGDKFDRNGRRAAASGDELDSQQVGKKTGTAVYICVPEGEMERYARVIGCFNAICDDFLRQTGGDADNIVPVLSMFEEAGNCPPVGLQERINVGRGRKMYNFVCYQNKVQPENSYGREGAKAIIEALDTMIFLPGLKGENAEFAAGMLGKTTVFQRSMRDSHSDSMDSENATETGRNLMDGDELRRLKKFTQMIIVHSELFPIRARFSDNQKIVDGFQSEPVLKTARNVKKDELEKLLLSSQNVQTVEITSENMRRQMENHRKGFDYPINDSPPPPRRELQASPEAFSRATAIDVEPVRRPNEEPDVFDELLHSTTPAPAAPAAADESSASFLDLPNLPDDGEADARVAASTEPDSIEDGDEEESEDFTRGYKNR